jgi:hypothetical protein
MNGASGSAVEPQFAPATSGFCREISLCTLRSGKKLGQDDEATHLYRDMRVRREIHAMNTHRKLRRHSLWSLRATLQVVAGDHNLAVEAKRAGHARTFVILKHLSMNVWEQRIYFH